MLNFHPLLASSVPLSMYDFIDFRKKPIQKMKSVVVWTSKTIPTLVQYRL